ncbi:YbjN domain-containing protein [Hoyosella sp. YIM 151337]|uniref:YbjN domain-containing protein n=1 Tax=Hoyosella sp. YIM 151337 TaxID=2992742 RepID=UPI0022355E01|nr:YbjN domain-containing protein [Hoyosella sp. YIM 151337]MCW4354980.1 YbjN domain-containing protein [Hoyosella sp. YIM 151337]
MAEDVTEDVQRSLATIEETLKDRELTYERRGDEHVIVELPGVRKLKTTCLLTVGVHGVRIEAFVCRHPDENEPAVHQYLLQRNRRLYGVAYTIDRNGDIYLVGRMSHHAVTPDELDRLLGQVLEAADGDFNVLLEIGFISSIRREWDWRISRGESLANLKAFEHLMKNGESNGDKDSDSQRGSRPGAAGSP